MNPYLKIKRYFATRHINRQIRMYIEMRKRQMEVLKKTTDKSPPVEIIVACLIASYFPAKAMILNALRRRRQIIKSFNK